MATFTKNYQLHQWDPQDPFLRTDFNQDLQKIDSALADIQNKMDETAETLENQCAMVKVAEVTIDAPTTQIDVDLSHIDVAAYERLVIYPYLPSDSNANYLVRLNHIDDEVYTSKGTTELYQFNYCGAFSPNGVLQSLELGCNQVCYYLIYHGFSDNGGTGSTFATTLKCSLVPAGEVESLNFLRESGEFLAHSSIRIYGIRK